MNDSEVQMFFFGFLPFCFGLLRRCGIWHQHRMEIDQSENVNTQMTNKETKHRWNTLTGNWGRSHSWGWTASSQPSTWDAKPVPNFCSKFLVDRPRGKQSHETINLNIFLTVSSLLQQLSTRLGKHSQADWSGHQLSASCCWLCVRSQASCYMTEVATSGGGRLSQG